MSEPQVSISATTPMAYASFWRRALAFLIDMIIVTLAGIIVFQPVLDFLGLQDEKSTLNHRSPFSVEILGVYSLGFLVTIIFSWLYFALQESGKHQATFGKRILKIHVARSRGARLTFGPASTRFFARFLSAAIFAGGFIMVLFQKRHRALHDLIARTVVLENATVKEPIDEHTVIQYSRKNPLEVSPESNAGPSQAQADPAVSVTAS